MTSDPYTALGAFLTSYEAERLALVLANGDTTIEALREIPRMRRPEATRLLKNTDLGNHRLEISLAVLWAIAGARSVRTTITPVWTMPSPESNTGRLTDQVLDLIDKARMSVVCSSFNFSKGSKMWAVLENTLQRPGMGVTVYLDERVGKSQNVADQLPEVAVHRSRTPEGRRLVNHAKFVIIDRTLVLSTSANFSRPAENTNIEFGLLVKDPDLAAAIEETMRAQQGVLYELVPPTNTQADMTRFDGQAGLGELEPRKDVAHGQEGSTDPAHTPPLNPA
jgi:phosphatidylserine/phosphatidylglycerophosphate/cardiolipin synthase-like enzyme